VSDFQTSIAAEKCRLTARREELTTQVRDLEAVIASVDHELSAIAAYETARTGKQSVKAPRGTKRDTVLAIIREHQPITRAQIVEKLGGDKGLSNMLNALKKAGKITASDGKYALALAI
jgi:hypothetical protein